VCTSAVVANPINNYSFSSILWFPPVSVRPNAELHFRWSAVARDFLGRALDPRRDIDMVELMLWRATHDTLRTKLRDGDLGQSDLAVVANVYTEKMLTEVSLFDFTSVGTPVTPEMILPFFDAASYPPDEYIYTVMIATGEELGAGTRMIQSFLLDPASTNTLVELTDTSTRLDYAVDLQSHEPTLIPAGSTNVTIDWTDMTENALGQAFIPNEITEVAVVRYDESIAEIESRFLEAELIAEDIWRLEAAGTRASFAALSNAAGEPFPGISDAGTWLVALICRPCANPAPWYLSVLRPCPAGR
jgi:hypothetical protein